jgi:hypothetical protein
VGVWLELIIIGATVMSLWTSAGIVADDVLILKEYQVLATMKWKLVHMKLVIWYLGFGEKSLPALHRHQ